jgi:hypothetical protein
MVFFRALCFVLRGLKLCEKYGKNIVISKVGCDNMYKDICQSSVELMEFDVQYKIIQAIVQYIY